MLVSIGAGQAPASPHPTPNSAAPGGREKEQKGMEGVDK